MSTDEPVAARRRVVPEDENSARTDIEQPASASTT
jgi:hypothetical protein